MSGVPSQLVNITMDAGTWGWLQISTYVCIALGIGVIVSLVYHFISEMRTPYDSKQIRKCNHKGKVMALLVGDDGNGEIQVPKRIGSEGYMETEKTKKYKFFHIAFFPRRGKVPDRYGVDEAHGKDLEKTRKMAEYINELNTRRTFLSKSKVLLWIGVMSKGVLMSIEAIAATQLVEKYAAAFEEAKTKMGIGANNIYFPIDIPAMKSMVAATSYNESQINALQADHEQIGREEAKKGEMMNKLVLIAGIAFGAMGLVGGIIIAMVG